MTPAKEIQRLARETLGIERLRPGQLQAIEAVTAGRDTLAVLATGYGKSAIYQLSGELMEGLVLSYFGEEHEPPCGNCDNCDAGLVEPESDANRPFEVGATVTHSEWGPGEVQRYDKDRVVVLFESVGYRTLDLELVSEKGLLRES